MGPAFVIFGSEGRIWHFAGSLQSCCIAISTSRPEWPLFPKADVWAALVQSRCADTIRRFLGSYRSYLLGVFERLLTKYLQRLARDALRARRFRLHRPL